MVRRRSYRTRSALSLPGFRVRRAIPSPGALSHTLQPTRPRLPDPPGALARYTSAKPHTSPGCASARASGGLLRAYFELRPRASAHPGLLRTGALGRCRARLARAAAGALRTCRHITTPYVPCSFLPIQRPCRRADSPRFSFFCPPAPAMMVRWMSLIRLQLRQRRATMPVQVPVKESFHG